MTQRERFLAGTIVGLLGLWGLWQGYLGYEAGYDRRAAEVRRLDDQLQDQTLAERVSRRAMERLERYQEQSLPSDPDVARSAYREWLIETAATAGLEVDNVKSSPSERDLDGAATALEFDLTGSGSPEAVTRFLDAYYRLDLLHQLTLLNVRPQPGADDGGATWGVTLKSVALSVAATTREAGLPEAEQAPARLSLASADEYVASVAGRNLLASYVPPPPPRPERPKVVRKPPPPKPTPPPFDDATQTKLTGIVGAGDTRQAWVFVRTTGEQLRLRADDPIEVGTVKGRVQAVLPREVLVESADGSVWRFELGDTLREAADAAASPDAA